MPHSIHNSMNGHLVRNLEELSASWATHTLRSVLNDDRLNVSDIKISTIGTGRMAKTIRLELVYDQGSPENAPESMIVKVPSTNETTRVTGSELGLYEAEILFYRDVASKLLINTPRCYVAAFDGESGYFTLALEDLSHKTEVGDVVLGGNLAQARGALTELARMQASCWNDIGLMDHPLFANGSRITRLFASYVDKAPPYIADFGEIVGSERVSLIERAMPYAPQWLAEKNHPIVVQHADYRLDNILYHYGGEDIPSATVVDWQTVRTGSPLVDVAYYLGGCLSVEDRRANEITLLREYLDTLQANGVREYGWNQLWHDYRRASLYGLFMGVSAYSLVSKSEHGKKISLASSSKRIDLILDLNGSEFLP